MQHCITLMISDTCESNRGIRHGRVHLGYCFSSSAKASRNTHQLVCHNTGKKKSSVESHVPRCCRGRLHDLVCPVEASFGSMTSVTSTTTKRTRERGEKDIVRQRSVSKDKEIGVRSARIVTQERYGPRGVGSPYLSLILYSTAGLKHQESRRKGAFNLMSHFGAKASCAKHGSGRMADSDTVRAVVVKGIVTVRSNIRFRYRSMTKQRVRKKLACSYQYFVLFTTVNCTTTTKRWVRGDR